MRPLDVALDKMQVSDFAGALQIAETAQRLFPGLENVPKIIATCQVHVAAGVFIPGVGTDWYEVMRVDRLADEAAVRKQYRRLALALHPDKNKFPGAEAAFKIVVQGNRVLTDPRVRQHYDCRYQTIIDYITRRSSDGIGNSSQQMGDPLLHPLNPNFLQYKFVTSCRNCQARLQFLYKQIGSLFRCPFCRYFSLVRVGEHVPFRSNYNAAENIRASERIANFQRVNMERFMASCRGDKPPENNLSSNGKRGSSINQWDGRKRLKRETKAQFQDFGNLRKEEAFGVDQVWACYDPMDSMPRRYALITKVTTDPSFRLQIKWLEVRPMSGPQRACHAVRLPIGCGNYRVGDDIQEFDNPQIFSHQAHVIRNRKLDWTVGPRKGEIWAVYKDWTSEWAVQPYQYDVVEILSNTSNPPGLKFIYLERVQGFLSVFRRCNRAVSPPVQVGRNEFLMFSHTVPFKVMAGTESVGIRKDYVELDTAALPGSFFESRTVVNQPEVKEKPTEPQPNQETMKVVNYDFGKERTVEKIKVGEVWAIITEKDKLPREFALIKKLNYQPELRIHVAMLKRSYSLPFVRSSCEILTVERGRITELEMRALSHRVGAEEVVDEVYKIFPKTGEVWAMFNSKEGEFDYVEVVGWDDTMAEVVLLEQLDGENAAFYRRATGAVPTKILEGYFWCFSHQCCAILRREEQPQELNGLWEIDAASKPTIIAAPT